jgi:hypothetical protein
VPQNRPRYFGQEKIFCPQQESNETSYAIPGFVSKCDMGTFISKLLLNVFIPTEACVLKRNRLFHINVKRGSVIDVRVLGFLLVVR